MLILKDLTGMRTIFYDYRIIKGEKGYIIQAGPYTLLSRTDPEAYASVVSLVDARGPPGIPSPFGLWVRQLVSAYIMLALIVVSFAESFWITTTVYMKAGVGYLTLVDIVSFVALVLSISWFIATIIRAMMPHVRIISLSAIGITEGYMEATPAIDVFSEYPPAELLKTLGREVKIVVAEGVKEIVDKLQEKVGDRSLAASILALLGQVYDTWRRSLGIVLQDQYDISVAARARYQLSQERRVPLSKYAGVIALVALIAAIIAIIIWLQPSIAPTSSATPTPTPTPTLTPMPSPATPPPPPGG